MVKYLTNRIKKLIGNPFKVGMHLLEDLDPVLHLFNSNAIPGDGIHFFDHGHDNAFQLCAFRLEHDQLIPPVTGIFHPGYKVAFGKIIDEVGEAGLILKSKIRKLLLVDPVLLPEAKQYLQHFKSDIYVMFPELSTQERLEFYLRPADAFGEFSKYFILVLSHSGGKVKYSIVKHQTNMAWPENIDHRLSGSLAKGQRPKIILNKLS